MSKFIGTSVLVAIATAFGLSSLAKADSESFTMTGVGPTLTEFNANVSFPMFDSSLGTLTQVTVALSTTAQTVITFTNHGLTASNGGGYAELQLGVNDRVPPNSSDPTSVPLSWMPTIVVVDVSSPALNPPAPFSFNFTGLAAGQSIASPVLTYGGTGSTSFTDSGTMAHFIGSGDMSLPVGTLVYDWDRTSGGNTNVTDVTSADVSGTVTYQYDDAVGAPLPAVAPAGFLGLLLAGGVRAVRRRRAAGR